MQVKDLLKVRVIILADVGCEIAENVLECGQRSAVVKCAVSMRDHNDDHPAWPYHCGPGTQSSEGIRDMLEDVGRQQKVVRAG